MVRDSNDFYRLCPRNVDNAERKLVEDKPAIAMMKLWPAERRLLNLEHRDIKLYEERSGSRPASLKVPSPGAFRLIRSKWVKAKFDVSHVERARGALLRLPTGCS